MKIGIITDYLDFQVTGIGNYVNNLVEDIVEIDKKNEYTLIHIAKRDNPLYSKVRDIVVPLPFFPPRATIRKNILIPEVIKREGFDLVHEPLQITPFLFRLPAKKVMTIHDMACLVRPEDYRLRERLYYRHTLGRAVKTADRIITISESSKRDIIKHLNVPGDKINVIYHGLDREFRPTEDTFGTRNRYGIDYPFILYVGKLEPRKNVLTLIKSFYTLKQRGIKHRLVLVAKKGSEYESISRYIRTLGLGGEIISIENISKDDMIQIYNLADLFVFPSLYEGFGLPPLEAMGCGTPVVTSNTSSLPEVVGDAGIMVDPFDIEGLANAMYEVLTNDGLRESLIKKGLDRAKQFSWENAAKETIVVYEEVAGEE